MIENEKLQNKAIKDIMAYMGDKIISSYDLINYIKYINNDFLSTFNYQEYFKSNEDLIKALENIYKQFKVVKMPKLNKNKEDSYNIIDMNMFIFLTEKKKASGIFLVHTEPLTEKQINIIEKKLPVFIKVISNNVVKLEFKGD